MFAGRKKQVRGPQVARGPQVGHAGCSLNNTRTEATFRTRRQNKSDCSRAHFENVILKIEGVSKPRMLEIVVYSILSRFSKIAFDYYTIRTFFTKKYLEYRTNRVVTIRESNEFE